MPFKSRFLFGSSVDGGEWLVSGPGKGLDLDVTGAWSHSCVDCDSNAASSSPFGEEREMPPVPIFPLNHFYRM